jgi:hypothetical protein
MPVLGVRSLQVDEAFNSGYNPSLASRSSKCKCKPLPRQMVTVAAIKLTTSLLLGSIRAVNALVAEFPR